MRLLSNCSSFLTVSSSPSSVRELPSHLLLIYHLLRRESLTTALWVSFPSFFDNSLVHNSFALSKDYVTIHDIHWSAFHSDWHPFGCYLFNHHIVCFSCTVYYLRVAIVGFIETTTFLFYKRIITYLFQNTSAALRRIGRCGAWLSNQLLIILRLILY